MELDIIELSLWEMWEVDIVGLYAITWLSPIVFVGKGDGSTSFVRTICWPLITQVLVFPVIMMGKELKMPLNLIFSRLGLCKL